MLSYSSFGSGLRAIRSGDFDEAWLLPNSFRAALLAFLAGTPHRIGYATDRRGWLLTEALPAPPRTRHQLRDYDALLEARHIPPDLDPPRLPLPDANLRRAEEALERAGLADAADLVLLCPGSAVESTKRWPVDRYARLAEAISARGISVAFAVGPRDRVLSNELAEKTRAPIPVVGLDLDPVELAAVFARARVVVANDSGPMHLAAAVGTGVVALFGPTDPGRTGPSGSPSRILDRYVFCSPCYRDRCPYGHECMREIEVDDVLGAIEQLIGVTRPSS